MATKKPAATAPAKTTIVANKKEFNAKAYEKPGLTAEQVGEIKVAFDLFDTDNGGSIDTKGTK